MRKNTISIFQVLVVGLFFAVVVFSQTDSSPETVYFRVSVTDKYGRTASGLKKENFKVREEKIEQEISYFNDKEEPASVAVLLDISESIDPKLRQILTNAVSSFVRAANSQNDYSLIAFGNEPYTLAEWGSTHEQMVEALNKLAVAKIKSQGTRLYDSCFFALEKLEKSKHPKKVVLILSDGVDTQSEKGFGKVREKVKSSDAQIYSISVINPSDLATLSGMQGQTFLEEFVSISGGKSFRPAMPDELDESVKAIVWLLQYQYVIGYKSKPSQKKDKWRSVEIKAEPLIDSKGKKIPLEVHTRKGYFLEKPTQ